MLQYYLIGVCILIAIAISLSLIFGDIDPDDPDDPYGDY